MEVNVIVVIVSPISLKVLEGDILKVLEGAVNVGFSSGYNIKSIISEKVLLLNVVPAGILGSSELGKSIGVAVAFV